MCQCQLDLTTAFNAVDHQQLFLHRLEHLYGLHTVHSVVLAWFSSYLTDRSFRVLYNGDMSSLVHVKMCSVLQGSVVGS